MAGKNAMSRAQLLALFERLARFDDPEWHDEEDTHKIADQALLAFIDDPEIAEAFDALPKWYA